MSNSYTFTICDEETGLPRTGLTVTMRYSRDNFAATAYTATEVDDENSPGEYRISNYVTAKYKTWINGSEDESFGGPYGKPLISEEDLILLDTLSAYWDFKNKRAANINDPVNDKDGANKQWTVAQYYSKTAADALLAAKVAIAGTETVTGHKLFEVLPTITPVISDGDDLPLPIPSALGDVIYKKYFDYRLSLLTTTPTPQSVQHIRVYGGATTIVGKLYPDILSAVNYCVGLDPAPDAGHVFVITIENMGAGVELMTAAAGSIRDYINLVALGNFISIIIGDDSLESQSSIEGATLYLGAGLITTARDFTFKLRDCTVYHYRDLTLTDGEAVNCKFIGAGSYKVILSGDCNVENCIFNNEPTVTAHTGVAIYDTVSGVYPIPDDPTVEV